MKKNIFGLALLLLALAFPALASQNSTTLPTVSPYPGLTMLGDINNALDSIQTSFSGASAPASPKAYQPWFDTTNNLLKYYNGSSWVAFGKLTSTGWQALNNGVPATFPTSTGSANAYVVTYSPAVATLVPGQIYPFLASFGNTGAATLTINGIGPYSLVKQGSVALASGDVPSGFALITVFDGTRFQIIGPLGNSSGGTVTTVATGTGLTGGPISTSGTVSLESVADKTGLVNTSGASAAPVATTLGTWLDSAFGSTSGKVLYRDTGGWTTASMGAHGKQVFLSGGTFNVPAGISTVWVSGSGGGGGGGKTSSTTGAAGSGGAGGGSGQGVIGQTITVTPSEAITVTIGSGGTGGTSGSGSAGGSTTFGAYLTLAGGGGGGAGVSGNVSGAGGAAGGAGGQKGNVGTYAFNGGVSGSGANSIFGAGGASGNGSTGPSAGVYGGGGGGGSPGSQNGADGGAGILVVEW